MHKLKIKTKKGLNIPIAGQPEQIIDNGTTVKRVALSGPDYVGLKPRMLVDVGQEVSLGEPLFFDKRDPQVQFVSPGTGRVVAINRARRRRLQSVVVELDDTAASEAVFDPQRAQNNSSLRDLLLRSGLWTSFRTRPYNRVADSKSTPRSIFVTAIDTRPLAADPRVVIAQRENEFKNGMAILRRLGDWPVYMCTGPAWSGPNFDDDEIHRVEFDGPHPAGLPGTHIHHLDPVAVDRMVWHIGYQDVIAIGHLFDTGRLLTERIVSVAGSGALKPRLLRTRQGANLMELLSGEIAPDRHCRVISGSALDGLTAQGPLGYLGRYHNQVSLISDSVQRRPFGWIIPITRQQRHSAHTCALNGRRAAMHPVEVFDRVMPMDILPAPLLRALLVKDTDVAQALGCLELAEEDLALSSFVCPAKQDYGAALRINLDQIEQEG